jgi:hypothetical protein
MGIVEPVREVGVRVEALKIQRHMLLMRFQGSQLQALAVVCS